MLVLMSVGAGVLVAIAAGTGEGWFAARTRIAVARRQSPPPPDRGRYATNAAGETYGSSSGAPPGHEPDLVAAFGQTSTGRIVSGYVKSAEMNAYNGTNVKSPQEAVAFEREAASVGERKIPLYLKNGTTVIGSFEVRR
ncbi:MAG TPA: hypothetical protein VMA83_04820 [Solirubrobacteraceae bacterium]|nr:hypothetical protein [Solirubrobacteraceae bacterium]